jgi:hypothetical protein
MKKVLALALTAVLIFPVSEATAAVEAGAKCKEVGQTKIKGQIEFRCMKSGTVSKWNSGKKINLSPSQSSSGNNLSFFQVHRSGNSEELLKIVISSKGVVQRKTKMTSGPKFGLAILDMRNKNLLLEVDAGESQLYSMKSTGGITSLGIKMNGGIPTDSRDLDKIRLSLDGKNIFAFDFAMDFYRIEISSGIPLWTRLFTGPQLKEIIGSLGGDSEYDWVQGFEILGKDELLLMTKNSFEGTLRFWNIKTSFFSESVPQVSKVGEFVSSNILGDDSVDISISPSGSQVAILHTASALTPKSRLLIYSVTNKTYREVAVSKLYEGNNYGITWLDEDKLLTTIDLVWTKDENGGRVTCLLRLKTAKKCLNIVGVSGYDLIGSR